SAAGGVVRSRPMLAGAPPAPVLAHERCAWHAWTLTLPPSGSMSGGGGGSGDDHPTTAWVSRPQPACLRPTPPKQCIRHQLGRTGLDRPSLGLMGDRGGGGGIPARRCPVSA